jgi:hypothetical protein
MQHAAPLPFALAAVSNCHADALMQQLCLPSGAKARRLEAKQPLADSATSERDALNRLRLPWHELDSGLGDERCPIDSFMLFDSTRQTAPST